MSRSGWTVHFIRLNCFHVKNIIFHSLFLRLIRWLINRLISFLIDWRIDWFHCWLIDWYHCWFNCWLIPMLISFIDSIVDWLLQLWIHWLSCWFIDSSVDSWSQLLIYWLSRWLRLRVLSILLWLMAWLIDWFTAMLTGGIGDFDIPLDSPLTEDVYLVTMADIRPIRTPTMAPTPATTRKVRIPSRTCAQASKHTDCLTTWLTRFVKSTIQTN